MATSNGTLITEKCHYILKSFPSHASGVGLPTPGTSGISTQPAKRTWFIIKQAVIRNI
jgi:hypothetical protein